MRMNGVSLLKNETFVALCGFVVRNIAQRLFLFKLDLMHEPMHRRCHLSNIELKKLPLGQLLNSKNIKTETI